MAITKNTLYVLLGSAAPMVAAVVALPVLVREIGVERLGIMSLVWVVLGYASVLDLGLGRAVTQATASCLGRREVDRVPGIFWSAVWLQGGLGLVVGVLLFMLVSLVKARPGVVPPHLADEVYWSIVLCSVSIPVIMMTSSVVGVLYGAQRFDIVSTVQAPAAFFQYVLPLLIILWRQDLPAIVLGLLATRWIVGAVLFVAAVRTVPGLVLVRRLRGDECVRLIRFGGWVTVSSVVSPLIAYLDRFLLGALAGVATIAFYTVPADIVVRLAVFPSSLATVLYPVFSGLRASKNEEETSILYARSVKGILLVLGLPVMGLIAFAPDLLLVWMGRSFAEVSGVSLQILLAGLLAAGIAYVPLAILQAHGRPDLVAKIQLAELPLFAVLVYWSISLFGVTGAALACTARAGLDAAALMVMSARANRGLARALRVLRVPESVALMLFLVPVAAVSGHVVGQIEYRLLITFALMIMTGWVSWKCLLTDEERAVVLQFQMTCARKVWLRG
jgi:O-antigen/teichoic acid export membrane protein